MTHSLMFIDEWVLGIDILDDDHRRLVELYNQLLTAFGPPEGPGDPLGILQGDGLIPAVTALGAEARAHFAREEAFMREIGFPAAAEHHGEHAMLMAEFQIVVRELTQRAARYLDEESAQTLKQWVLAHILGGDRSFVEHYLRLCGQDV